MMHWLGIFLYSLIVLWLMPGAIWRPVACALLATWALQETLYQFTRDFEPIWLYIPCDWAVIGTALLKRSHWSDWLIVCLYPAIWMLYTRPESQGQWLALYWAFFVQCVIAGPWPQIAKALNAYSHGSRKEKIAQQEKGRIGALRGFYARGR